MLIFLLLFYYFTTYHYFWYIINVRLYVVVSEFANFLLSVWRTSWRFAYLFAQSLGFGLFILLVPVIRFPCFHFLHALVFNAHSDACCLYSITMAKFTLQPIPTHKSKTLGNGNAQESSKEACACQQRPISHQNYQKKDSIEKHIALTNRFWFCTFDFNSLGASFHFLKTHIFLSFLPSLHAIAFFILFCWSIENNKYNKYLSFKKWREGAAGYIWLNPTELNWLSCTIKYNSKDFP